MTEIHYIIKGTFFKKIVNPKELKKSIDEINKRSGGKVIRIFD